MLILISTSPPKFHNIFIQFQQSYETERQALIKKINEATVLLQESLTDIKYLTEENENLKNQHVRMNELISKVTTRHDDDHPKEYWPAKEAHDV